MVFEVFVRERGRDLALEPSTPAGKSLDPELVQAMTVAARDERCGRRSPIRACRTVCSTRAWHTRFIDDDG